jgi:GxxExxY protein
VAIPVRYREARLDVGFRLDLLVERSVIFEIKAIDALASIHTAQVLTYLKFSNLRLGYLVNFNVSRLKDGLRRIVL